MFLVISIHPYGFICGVFHPYNTQDETSSQILNISNITIILEFVFGCLVRHQVVLKLFIILVV